MANCPRPPVPQRPLSPSFLAHLQLPKLIGEAMGDDSQDLVHGGGREPGVPDVGVAAALPLDRL